MSPVISMTASNDVIIFPGVHYRGETLMFFKLTITRFLSFFDRIIYGWKLESHYLFGGTPFVLISVHLIIFGASPFVIYHFTFKLRCLRQEMGLIRAIQVQVPPSSSLWGPIPSRYFGQFCLITYYIVPIICKCNFY